MKTGNRLAQPEEKKKDALIVDGSKANRKKKLTGWIIGILAGLAVLGCGSLLAAPALIPTVFARTTVMGVDMGGMTREQAAAAWRDARDALRADTAVELRAEGETLTTRSLAELGADITPEAAARAAWDAGHGGNLLDNALALIRSWRQDTAATPAVTVDDAVLNACVADISENLNCTVVDGEYALRQEGELGPGLYLTKPCDGRVIDGDRLAEELRTRLSAADFSPVDCTYRQMEAKKLDLQAIYDELHDEMAESVYDRETGEATQSHVGVDFDVAAVQAQLDAQTPGATFLADAQVAFPKVTTEMLQEALFRDVLGTCTTKVSGSSARIRNVYLAAQCIDGKVYNPGEEFWYNATVGQRTEARGFGAAPAYVGGKTVDSVGGGVCQVSSTLYYATLLADLQIVLRYCHQFAPAYITWGCDATVSWGGPDYAFRNNTDYPIKIVTAWNDNNLTTTILGTKTDDTYVKMVSQTLSSTGWSEVYEVNPELPYGSDPVVVQTPYTGYFVRTYRNVYDGEDNLISSTFEANSDYEARDKIIQVPPDYYYYSDVDTGGDAA